MKSNSKLIIIILIVISVIAAAFFLLKDKLFKNNTDDDPEKKTSPTPGGVSIVTDSEFPLKKGSRGLKVKQLQAGLNILKKAGLDVDGKFGTKTEKALNKNFGITKLSQYDYDKYVYPYLDQINLEINKTSSYSGTDAIGKNAYSNTDNTEIYPAVKVFGVGDFLEIGEVKGYTPDLDKPGSISNEGILLGSIEQIYDKYFLILAPDGSRIFSKQSQTNIL